ncbi:hypothetical protein SLS56_001332 [Neofusicoccum ribis]|uniref:4'-phosphopantetheinyl transferase domain-containing protein n=1 Tax=Neofusicoccum ribis TaxID=45134 RepID=A0ABR3T8U9_9PEZI
MPPRPFPYPCSVGVDICSIQRVKSLVQRRPRHAQPESTSLPQLHPFLARVFSFHEILLFNLRFKTLLHEPATGHDPALVTSAVRYLAGRFAAKEAVIKAVQSRRILLKDVLVATDGGQPYAIVLDRSPVMTHVQRLYLNQTYGFSIPISTETDQHVASSPSPDLEGHPDVASGLEQCEGQVAKLSISHDGDYATAVCLAAVQSDSTSRTLL